MVLVPSFVVHPCFGVAFLLPFEVVRRLSAEIVFGAQPEFGETVFRQVVCQSLPVQPAFEAVSHDEVPVSGDGQKMFERMHNCTFSDFWSLFGCQKYIFYFFKGCVLQKTFIKKAGKFCRIEFIVYLCKLKMKQNN